MPKRAQPQVEMVFGGTVDATAQNAYLSRGKQLLQVIAEVVQQSGAKQGAEIAEDVGADPTQFSQALAGNGKHFSVKWLPRVLRADREHRILKLLAEMSGLEVRPKRIENPRQVARALAELLLDQGEVGLAMARKRLGARAADVLEAAANDDAEEP